MGRCEYNCTAGPGGCGAATTMPVYLARLAANGPNPFCPQGCAQCVQCFHGCRGCINCFGTQRHGADNCCERHDIELPCAQEPPPPRGGLDRRGPSLLPQPRLRRGAGAMKERPVSVQCAPAAAGRRTDTVIGSLPLHGRSRLAPSRSTQTELSERALLSGSVRVFAR